MGEFSMSRIPQVQENVEAPKNIEASGNLMEEEREPLHISQELEKEMEEALRQSESEEEHIQYEGNDIDIESGDDAFEEEEELPEPQSHTDESVIPIEQQTGSMTFQDPIPFINNMEVGDGFVSFDEDIHQAAIFCLGKNSDYLLELI